LRSLAVFISIYFLICFTKVVNGETVEQSLGDCQTLLEHLPQSDIEFKAGFDVRGKKVEVADYKGGSSLKLKAAMSFDFAIDIARKYNLSKKKLNAEMPLVSILIKDGRVFLDNNLITRKDQSDLVARCRAVLNLK
jgi:hypothetical protein